MAQGTNKTKQKVPMEKFLNKARNSFLGTNPPPDHNSVNRNRGDQTRAFYYDSGQQKNLALFDIASLVGRNGQENATMIVIENINPHWRVELSRIFDIDATFFDEHALNPEGPSPWRAIFGPKQLRPTQRINYNSHQSPKLTTTMIWHVDGVYSCEFSETDRVNPKTSRMEDPNFNQRRLEYDFQYGWQANTRLSHCQVNDNIYIFLVDAPMRIASSFFSPMGRRATLRLPISNSRGGVELPALLGHSEHSIFDCLKQFFSHQWHVGLIKHQVLSPETVLYLLIASTWSYNLREMKQSIRHIAFNELRRPRIEINDRLLDERQKIVLLSQEVADARKWIPAGIKDELRTVETEGYVAFPDLTLEEVLEEAETTEKFLMDTFQLLISSISVLDSETSVKLTQLAFIFVPLNLVTSIFGMNLAEINGSPLPAWMCVLVLIAVIACTVGIFAAYNQWEKRVRQ